MSSFQLEEVKSDIEEFKRLLSAATRPRVKDILTVEIRKFETELIKLNELHSSNSQEKSSAPTVHVNPAQRCYDVKITNYAWDQTDKYVKLYVTLKNVQTLDSTNITCQFTRRSAVLWVNGLDNRNYFLPINNLLMDIDDSKSHFRVKKDMVIVFLSKVESTQWKYLFLVESKLKESSKKDLTDGLDANSDDPSQGLMNIMRKMYEEGDDEMKRTIAKAWTEGREKNMRSNDL